MQRCLDTASEAGLLPRDNTPKEKEVRQVGLQQVANEELAGMTQIAEAGATGHKKMKGTTARVLLGWKPTRLEDAWRKGFADELVAPQEDRRGDMTIEGCIAMNKVSV